MRYLDFPFILFRHLPQIACVCVCVCVGIFIRLNVSAECTLFANFYIVLSVSRE